MVANFHFNCLPPIKNHTLNLVSGGFSNFENIQFNDLKIKLPFLSFFLWAIIWFKTIVFINVAYFWNVFLTRFFFDILSFWNPKKVFKNTNHLFAQKIEIKKKLEIR